MERGFAVIRLPNLLSTLALLSATISFGLVVPKPAHAVQKSFSEDECKKLAKIEIEPLESVLKKAGIATSDDICKEQSKFDDGRHCEKSFEKLIDLEDQRYDLISARCSNAADMQDIQNCDSKKCQTQRVNLLKEAALHDSDEKKLLAKMRKELDSIFKYQMELAKGAHKIQEETKNKSDANPSGRDVTDIDKLGKARDTNYKTNEQASSFFKDSLSTVSGLIEKMNSKQASSDEINQLKTPLTREPLQIASASTSWDQQMEKRQQTLDTHAAGYASQGATGTSRASDMGSVGNTAQAANQAAQTASNETASAGGNSGGSGGGGSGSAEGSSSTPSSSAYSTPRSYASNNSGTTADAYQPSGAGKVGLASSSNSDKKSGTNAIENVETIIAANDPTLPSSSGASASKGSSLRSALRDRLNGMSSRSGASNTRASVAPGAGGTGAMASSGALPDGLLPEAKTVAAEDPLAASSGSTGGDLGNTDFSMGGSDTDAAVHGMLKEFNAGRENGGRELASSESHSAPEILAKDSASLFLRSRETHFRALKNGLLVNGLGSKL